MSSQFTTEDLARAAKENKRIDDARRARELGSVNSNTNPFKMKDAALKAKSSSVQKPKTEEQLADEWFKKNKQDSWDSVLNQSERGGRKSKKGGKSIKKLRLKRRKTSSSSSRKSRRNSRKTLRKR